MGSSTTNCQSGRVRHCNQGRSRSRGAGGGPRQNGRARNLPRYSAGLLAFESHKSIA